MEKKEFELMHKWMIRREIGISIELSTYRVEYFCSDFYCDFQCDVLRDVKMYVDTPVAAEIRILPRIHPANKKQLIFMHIVYSQGLGMHLVFILYLSVAMLTIFLL